MSKYWSELVNRIEPYTPGEQPRDKKYIKLNTNENPYPPSPKVLEAIKNAAGADLRLYPDPDCTSLRTALAGYYGFDKEEVFVGNGSDEVLAFAFMAFFNPGRKVLFTDITYSFYPVYCGLFSIEYEQIPLNDDFSVPYEKFFRENGGIILANPNAPTTRYLTLEAVEEVLKRNMDSVVIFDEAYIDFGGNSAANLVKEYPNLLIVQTLSKSRSLAGLRVGFALGQRDLITALERIKNSFNSYTLDRLALAAAEAAIKDEDYFIETTNRVVATREWVSKSLAELGFKVVESKANFIFISHERVPAGTIFRELKERGVLVRYFRKPRIDNYLRVSVGSDSEMEVFLDKLAGIVRAAV